MIRPGLAALAALLPLQTLAQEAGDPRVAFSLRGGVEAVPGYFGSDELTVGPDLGFSFGSLSLGSLSLGDPDPEMIPQGFRVRGSFRYIPERSSDKFEELAGLQDVEAAIELGAGIAYSRPWWETFADLRYGLTGHKALVADLGMDLIARPTDRLTLRAGPRVFLGSDSYAATYFGVTEGEALASARPVLHQRAETASVTVAHEGHVDSMLMFDPFEAQGGVLSAGVDVGMEYRLTDPWGIAAGIRYERLTNDAADSPITVEDDQLSVFIGITRRFEVRF